MTDLKKRAAALKLHGLLDHWPDLEAEPWVEQLILWEEQSRAQRGLERRMRQAKLGTFKPLADFDWSWPKKIDRLQIDEILTLDWLDRAANLVLVGPNGVGKTMIAKNVAHQAVLAGVSVRYFTASELLNTLAEQESSTSLRRKLAFFTRPRLVVIDELGYLSYDARHADLLFEVVSRRYEQKSIVLTTNKPFAEWGEVFPNAASVVTLIDRLVHRCEIVPIEGDSYRLKESKEEEAKRNGRRRGARRKKSGS